MSQTLVFILGSTGGALATYYLHKYGLSVVVASCLVGLVGAGLEHLLKIQNLGFVVFAGSFVGMSGSSVRSLPLIILGGALSGIIYQYTTHIFKGFGGRLGTIAFVSTVASFYLLTWLKKWIFKK